ncbi:MAG: 2-oxo acid dehydrogenase subunit E2 [Christiangramia sp.]
MAKEIKIPQIAEGVESATVTEVLVKEGDSIEKDQSLITVESDKASVEIPSPEAGTVKSISVSEGDEVSVGDVILKLEAGESEEDDSEDEEKEEKTKKDSDKSEEKDKDSEEETKDEEDSEDEEKKKKTKEDADASEEKKEKTKKDKDLEEEADEEDDSDDDKKSEKTNKDKDGEDSEEKDDSEDEDTSDTGDVPAAPGVRRLARELGVDISQVEGSGEGGRISRQDVKDAAKSSTKSGGKSEGLSLPDFSQWGQTERKPLSGIRKATAKNTAASWSNIPHVFQFDEANISGIEEYLEKLQEKTEGDITITAVLIKIAASALRQFPKFNASIDLENDEMILKKYVNIGVAVDTDKGLLVPVIRDVDQKTIIEIAKEITDLAEKAREGKLTTEEMKGGNFTISNLGGIGGTNFTPIVPHPQVAILGVSRAKKQPVYIDGNFEPRDILPLSLSYDHRMIDGADGVRFLHWIARALEDPYGAMLGA